MFHRIAGQCIGMLLIAVGLYLLVTAPGLLADRDSTVGPASTVADSHR